VVDETDLQITLRRLNCDVDLDDFYPEVLRESDKQTFLWNLW